MAIILSDSQIFDDLGVRLAGPMPRRDELGEIMRALQVVERQLHNTVQDHARRHGMEAQHALRAFHLIEQTLDWAEQHGAGMLRLELRHYLRLVHGHAETVLAKINGPPGRSERLLG